MEGKDMDHTLNSMGPSERRDSSVSSLGSLSSLTKEERMEKVKKYWQKKQARKNNRFIRYECRKDLAEKRYRYQGRFVKFDTLAELDPDMIYNPNDTKLPKTKQIFKVHKDQRFRNSSHSSHTSDS